MAQATYSISTTTYKGRALVLRCSVKNSDAVSNCTEISWRLAGIGESGYVTCGNFKVVIDGKTVYESTDRKNVYNYTSIANGTTKIYHYEDGTRTVYISIEAGIHEVKVNRSASGTWELPPLARYSNITSFSVNPRDETSVTYTFGVDAPTDWCWYSTDDGNTWNDLPTTNIVSGLSAGTTYKFKLRVRNTETQLTKDSATYSQTTYNYPHCIDAPNFTIGDRFTLTFYNPLSKNISVVGYAISDGRQIFGGTTTGTSLTGFNVNDANGGADAQYASIPYDQSGTYKLVVRSGDHEEWCDIGSVYSIRGDEVPTLNYLRYEDGNNSTVALTGNNQYIVQNKSELYAIFGDASANYGSPLYYYLIECNGVTMEIPEYGGSYNIGTVNSSRDVELKLTAYDRRGLSASKTVTVKVLAYEPPKATVELKRLNNYENETYLTVDASVSSVDGKNTMLIQYRHKQSGGEYTMDLETIQDREKQTLSFDKNLSYIFNIVVTDAFGETFDKEFVLNKGLFPLFIDTVKNSVGVNCFPTAENSLEVNGFNVYDLYRCEKNISLCENGDGLKITIENWGEADKFALTVAGADNALGTPVYKVIRIKDDGGFGEVNLGANSTTTAKKINGKVVIHIAASQWSYFTVKAPFGCEITLSNGALEG